MVEACKRVAEAERSVLEAMKKVGNNVKKFSKMLQEQIDTPQEKDVGAGKNGLQEAVIRLKAAAEEREQASQDRAQAASERTAAALRAQEERDRDSKERLDTLRILVGARESRFEGTMIPYSTADTREATSRHSPLTSVELHVHTLSKNSLSLRTCFHDQMV